MDRLEEMKNKRHKAGFYEGMEVTKEINWLIAEIEWLREEREWLIKKCVEYIPSLNSFGGEDIVLEKSIIHEMKEALKET